MPIYAGHPLTLSLIFFPVQLRRWADIVLVCPCSANTLAKLASGLCDNLLTSLLRATDPGQTPVVLFPAMNTLMWQHPLTEKHLKVVKEEIGYEVVGPIEKGLACGDTGARRRFLTKSLS